MKNLKMIITAVGSSALILLIIINPVLARDWHHDFEGVLYDWNCDFNGHDVDVVIVYSLLECVNACLNNGSCNRFTYSPRARSAVCYLKKVDRLIEGIVNGAICGFVPGRIVFV